VIARFGAAGELALRKQVAQALLGKGNTLSDLGRSEEEIAVYDEVIARFGTASELALRKQVALALVNKGVTLSDLGRSQEEIAVYDEMIARFGTDDNPALKTVVENAKQARASRAKAHGSRTESQ
jgi:tetratricopeptide (TPR) repeat protein